MGSIVGTFGDREHQLGRHPELRAMRCRLAHELAKTHSLRAVARFFNTSAPTVRRWIARAEGGGLAPGRTRETRT